MSIEVLEYVASGCVATHAVWGARAKWAKRPRQPQRALDVSEAALLDECERAKAGEKRKQEALKECVIAARGDGRAGDPHGKPWEQYAVEVVRALRQEHPL